MWVCMERNRGAGRDLGLLIWELCRVHGGSSASVEVVAIPIMAGRVHRQNQ
jgi:hypothetical protein